MFAVEVACELIEKMQGRNIPTPEEQEQIAEDLRPFVGLVPLLEILIDRSSDKVCVLHLSFHPAVLNYPYYINLQIATVRAKAISNLASTFEIALNNPTLKEGTTIRTNNHPNQINILSSFSSFSFGKSPL